MNDKKNIPEQPDPSIKQEAIEQPETPEHHPESTNMEVHHHPHAHHKKKWTDYLFEFLMLFLAVSAGFFVENQREHYVEHHRSEQYAVFLFNDLVRDTINLAERTAFMWTGTKKLDTLIDLLRSFKDNDSVTAKIYDLSAYAYSGVFFSATTSTMDQLKNSGSLRYFKDTGLVGHFSRYDTDLQRLKGVEDRNAYLNEQTRTFLVQFLDLNNIERVTPNISTDASGPDPVHASIPGSLKLYKTDREQLNQYANLCALKKIDWTTRMDLQKRLLNSARDLIASLKKEYEIK
jgi:hypothetical protein